MAKSITILEKLETGKIRYYPGLLKKTEILDCQETLKGITKEYVSRRTTEKKNKSSTDKGKQNAYFLFPE